MKTLKLILLISLAFATTQQSSAQTPFCAFDSLLNDINTTDPIGYTRAKASHVAAVQHYRKRHPNLTFLPSPEPTCETCLQSGSYCPEAHYLLPVVVHVIHQPSDTLGQGTNISDAQVEHQIELLNDIYRNKSGLKSVNTGIQFCLAKKRPDGSSFNGINRVASDSSVMHRNNQNELTSLIHYPTDQYINIYVVKAMLNNNNDTLDVLGFATYPYYGSRANDLIVVRSDWFGDHNGYSNINSFSKGKTLIHEMGHYLGLYHPFQDSCQGSDTSTCGIKGDLCCDVPQVRTGVPGDCGPSNTCTDTPTDSADQKENHMDYAYDSCRTRFTENQVELMYATLNGVRSSLWQPNNINNLQLTCCVNAIAFSGQTDVCNNGDSIYLTAYDYDSTTYTWYLYKNGSPYDTINGGNHNTIALLPDTGLYDVKLVMTKGGDVLDRTVEHAFEVFLCDSLLPSTQGSWYFGQYSGIRFYNNGLVLRDIGPQRYKAQNPSKEQIDAAEGSISICDEQGGLLFYGGVNGGHTSQNLILYDSNYQEMAGGSLNGNGTATQGLATCQIPQTANKYYVFHSIDELNYSIVDMTQRTTTLGEIVATDIEILDTNNDGFLCDEGMTIIPGCDSTFNWLIVPAKIDNSSLDSSYLVKFKIDKDTVLFHSKSLLENEPQYQSQLKASPNGKFLSLDLGLYSFDRSTGEIELISFDTSAYLQRASGCCFSPNSEYLYRVEELYNDSLADPVYFNLTQTRVYDAVPFRNKRMIRPANYHRILQIGPDDKIYVSALNQNYVSVIEYPNLRYDGQNNIGFVEEGVLTSRNGVGGTCILGLPNHIEAKGTFEIENSILATKLGCDSFMFTPTNSCGTSYLWNLGDGSTSTQMEVAHRYTEIDSFEVVLVVDGDTTSLQVGSGFVADIAISGSRVSCDSSEYSYTVTNNDNYVYDWTVTGGSYFNPFPHQVDVSWNDSGTVKLVLTDLQSGCIDSNEVKVKPMQYADIEFWQSPISCGTYQFNTHYYCDSSYYWDFGDGNTASIQNPIHTYSDTGKYVVRLIVAGDTAVDTVQGITNFGNLAISGDTANCDVVSAFMYSTPYDSTYNYNWSSTGTSSQTDSANTSKVVWQQSGMIQVVVTSPVNACMDTASLTVLKVREDSLYFTYQVDSCLQVTFSTLDYCGLEKKWFFGDGSTTIGQTPSHTYTSRGVYDVQLIVGPDTVLQSIILDNPVLPVINGQNQICDTSDSHLYYLSGYVSTDSFLWSVDYGTATNPDSSSVALIQFADSSQISIVYTSEIGCIDTLTKSVAVQPDLDSNTIELLSTHCNSDSNSMIGGSIPIGGIGSYSFQWFAAGTDTVFTQLSDTTQNLIVLAGQLKKFYYRKVISNGCVLLSDTLEITIGVPINPNNPHNFQITACKIDDVTITYLTPTGGDGTYTYKWYKKVSGVLVELSETTESLNPTSNGEYYRKVISGGCERLGAAVEVFTFPKTNSISHSGYLCSTGSEVNLTGNTVLSSNGTTSYSWEYSTDSTVWFSTDSTTKNLTFTQNFPVVYYRRHITYNDGIICSKYSNVIKVKPHGVTFNQQPQDFYMCSTSLGDWTFTAAINNPNNVTVDDDFQYKNVGGAWTPVFSSGFIKSNPLINNENIGSAHNDSVRFVATIGSCKVYSDVARIILRSGAPVSNVNQQPTNQTVHSGQTAMFTANASLLPDETVKWQVKEWNTSSWVDVSSSNSDTLYVEVNDICQDSSQYRFVVVNDCGTKNSNSVYLLMNDSADIWMRDSWEDVGLEPNPDSSHYDIVLSPDIWNRVDDTLGIKQEAPEYKTLSPNYVRVKVRNRGGDTSLVTPLYLYWTFASINGEKWKRAWQDVVGNQHFNCNGDTVPMGDNITDSPIMVPRIAPGDSIIINYPWYPPNPASYCTAADSTPERINVCLLARLQHCSSYPHKMTVDEKFDVHVKHNVINNNNIITKNLWVYDSIPGNGAYGGGRVKTPWNTMGGDYNPQDTLGEDTSIVFKPCIEVLHPDFLLYWDVFLVTDDLLKDAIVAVSPQNPHVSYLGDNTFVIGPGESPCIGGVTFADNIYGFFRLEFEPKGDPMNIPQEVFDIGIAQYNGTGPTPATGACVFRLDNTDGMFNVEPSSPPPPPSSTLIEDDKNNSENKPVIEWQPQPNPAETGVEVKFNLVTNRYVEIEIYDALGRKLAFKERGHYRKGSNSVFFDVHDWPTGIYYVHFKYDGFYDAKRLVIQKTE